MGCCHKCMAALCVFIAGCLSVSPPSFYTEELLKHFGSNKSMDIAQLEELLVALKADATKSHEKKSENPTNGHADACSKASWVENEYCRKKKCLSSKGIYQLHNISEATQLDSSTFKELCPTLLYQAQNEGSCVNYSAQAVNNESEKSAKMWGFGFLFVTIVNLCSLGGIFVLPFMSKTFYHWLLMFLVALAVGTLVGSAAFFLIPDAFEMPEHDPDGKYIWKSAMVCVGVYMFFLIERILKMIMDYRMEKSARKEELAVEVDLSKLPTASIKSHREVDNGDMKILPETQAHIHHNYGGPQHSASSAQLVDRCNNCEQSVVDGRSSPRLTDKLLEDPEANGTVAPMSNGPTGNTSEESGKSKKVIAPVAWMIIIGDALHNFVDGLSIGAAFTVSTLAGISVSLAVICEEFPHELGDFAILINAGMTKWQALGFNFLSALSCYLGLVIGITVGENFNASQWIFALAGGMFLYISLVDMMNDVNHATEEKEFKDCKMKLFIVQNLGLLTGFGLMLILALFSGDIQLE